VDARRHYHGFMRTRYTVLGLTAFVVAAATWGLYPRFEALVPLWLLAGIGLALAGLREAGLESRCSHGTDCGRGPRGHDIP
jgi:hypothetical protein